MKRNRNALPALVIAISVLLILSGCSLAKLQDGLVSPPQELVERASIDGPTSHAAISGYKNFEVPSSDNVRITTYMREHDNAHANILLLHGAGGGAWVWEAYFELLPKEYNLYAMSWRGHFDSSSIEDANTQDHVIDQSATVEAIHARNDLPIHVVGHSYGAAIATLMAAESEFKFASLHLLAPVVPIDYTFSQRMLVPLLASWFIEKENNPDGTYGAMFLNQEQMLHYHKLYAGEDFSVEKPSLIGGDGVSPSWQEKLEQAYRTVAERKILIWFYIAKYDNVVVPRRQRTTAAIANATVAEFESGHYVQLDAQATESAATIARQLKTISPAGRSSIANRESTEASPGR